MYAESELMSPYLQNFSQEVQLFDEFGYSHKPNASLGLPSSFIQTSSTMISDYNLGGEGDLFKAPEPVIGEPSIGFDPMTAAMSMISSGDVICSLSLTVSDIESSIENGQLLSEVFYECKKDLLAKEGNETPLSEALSARIPTDGTYVADEKSAVEGLFQKSVSSGSLRSMDSMVETSLKPNFLDFPVLDFGAVYGMRRAFSEGDIEALGAGDISLTQSPMRQYNIARSCSSEDRREKLSRYRIKKSKRNFGRKIKYACRKALADSQPRIRGRFAKTEEIESIMKQ